MNTEQYIDHETRIRMLENGIFGISNKFSSIDAKFDKLEEKIDRNFHWTITLLFASVLLPIILKASGLT